MFKYPLGIAVFVVALVLPSANAAESAPLKNLPVTLSLQGPTVVESAKPATYYITIQNGTKANLDVNISLPPRQYTKFPPDFKPLNGGWYGAKLKLIKPGQTLIIAVTHIVTARGAPTPGAIFSGYCWEVDAVLVNERALLKSDQCVAYK